MIDGARISALIDLIYRCALDSALYPLALEAVRADFNFHNAALQVWTPEMSPVLSLQSGVPERWLAMWPDYIEDMTDLWGGWRRIAEFPLEEPVVQSQAVDPELTRANRYYREWVTPQGITDAVAMMYGRAPDLIGTLTFGRHGSAGPVGEVELEGLRLLAPHFRRAAEIGRLLEMQTVRAESFAEVLNRLSHAMFFLDGAARVAFANASASALAEAGDGLAVRHGVLTLTNASAQAALRRALADRAEPRAVDIGFRGRNGAPLVAHLTPLALSAWRTDEAPGATAALFVTSGSSRPKLPREALAGLYGLTDAEGRVAELLAENRTLEEIGRALGIARTTAATHLARLFAKTNCNRQAELAALLRGFSAP